MNILQFTTESLGDASYLVVGAGSAAAVDPQRDIRPLVIAARSYGVNIDYVFETHVHNDYISGGRELAALGAKVVAPGNSGLEFPHIPLASGDSLSFGGVSLQAMAAPGHTYEHTAYLAADRHGQVRGAFTGGSLLMGATGRSDLLGPDHTDELTRLQWESSRAIAAALTPETELLPTHGSGSFCSISGAPTERRGPLLVEQQRNPALTTDSADDFRAIQLANPAPIPGYYRYMAPINRSGPRVTGEPPKPPALTAGEITAGLRNGITVVDLRARAEFARAHAVGSVGIEESDSALAYVGWLIPFNAPLMLIAESRAQASRFTTDLYRIGYENVQGYIPWAAWKESDSPTERMETVRADQARQMLREGSVPVLDLRYENEQNSDPLPGALKRSINTLPDWIGKSPARALLVCASGQRSVMGASFLKRAGVEVVAFDGGGASDLY